MPSISPSTSQSAACRVLIFSLEMDDEQIGDRIIVSEFFRFRRPDGSYEITPMDYSTRLNESQFEKAQSILQRNVRPADLHHR